MAVRDPARVDRILDAARDLGGARGYRRVSISDIAEQSRVGKGTVYLHWPTKEAIFVDLILRSIEAVLTQLVNDITHDPAAARPQNLITSLITYALQEPVVRTLQDGDEELLHTIARDPRSAALVRDTQPIALLDRLVPIWQKHGYLSTSTPVDEQIYTLQLIALGARQAEAKPSERFDRTLSPESRRRATTTAIKTLLLDPNPDTPADADLATQTAAILNDMRRSLPAERR